MEKQQYARSYPDTAGASAPTPLGFDDISQQYADSANELSDALINWVRLRNEFNAAEARLNVAYERVAKNEQLLRDFGASNMTKLSNR